MIYLTETKVVEGVCPSFSGFYETAWGGDWDSHLENESDHFGVVIKYDYLDIDYAKYQNDIAEYYTGEVETDLVKGGFITSMKFQKVNSPREYNFSTDKLDVELTITEDNYSKIVEYLENNDEDFKDYITANFSDRSGFYSFYSNDHMEWYKTLVADKLKCEETQISSILEFIFDNEFKDRDDYDYVSDWGGSNSLNDYYSINEKATPADVLEAINAKDDE
jgi:hypothetical protein